ANTHGAPFHHTPLYDGLGAGAGTGWPGWLGVTAGCCGDSAASAQSRLTVVIAPAAATPPRMYGTGLLVKPWPALSTRAETTRAAWRGRRRRPRPPPAGPRAGRSRRSAPSPAALRRRRARRR